MFCTIYCPKALYLDVEGVCSIGNEGKRLPGKGDGFTCQCLETRGRLYLIRVGIGGRGPDTTIRFTIHTLTE